MNRVKDRSPLSMNQVLNMPEFKAFAERIGIDLGLPTQYLKIEMDGPFRIVQIEHTHWASLEEKDPELPKY